MVIDVWSTGATRDLTSLDVDPVNFRTLLESPAVFRVERDVVRALSSTDDPALRARVEDWVEGSLADMPELLRAGVAAESLMVAVWRRVQPSRSLDDVLDAMERSPVGLLQQYPRLFRSLVLFGDLELVPAPR